MRSFLTFIPKNERRSMMRQILGQKNFVARQNHCVVRQKLSAIR